jgi:hypothetical protein
MESPRRSEDRRYALAAGGWRLTPEHIGLENRKKRDCSTAQQIEAEYQASLAKQQGARVSRMEIQSQKTKISCNADGG